MQTRAMTGTRLWHPFAAMNKVDGAELVVVRGQGTRVWDADGREYLDATAGLWFANVGHGRAELADAAAAQMRMLAAHQTFGDVASEPALRLAERIAGLVPLDDPAVFFGSGGSDAVDTAGKIVRRYWSLLGQPERQVIVSRRFAYHGVNAYGTSLGGIAANQEGLGTLVPDVLVVGDDDPDELAAALDELGPRAAAFIGEPVIGAGGVIPPPDGYWPAVERILRERDVLFVADEVICGFGRLGTWFGVERYGVTPDLITCAKGITSGYIPLGAVVASGKVRAPFWADGAPPFRHGYTYSGHAAACAVALANLDILEREGLLDRVRAAEAVLVAALDAVAEQPGVLEVRHAGLLGTIELDPELVAGRPGAVDEVVLAARARGVLTRALRGTSLQISPAFVVSDDDLRTIVSTIAEAVAAVAATA
jgi:adenosylmethionine-8-amino-7-oxononanoate aminotransferase